MKNYVDTAKKNLILGEINLKQLEKLFKEIKKKIMKKKIIEYFDI